MEESELLVAHIQQHSGCTVVSFAGVVTSEIAVFFVALLNSCLQGVAKMTALQRLRSFRFRDYLPIVAWVERLFAKPGIAVPQL
jgi:hypothetical protein